MVPEITSWSDQPVGASTYPQKNFSAKILIPKDSGGFTLASLTDRSHQVGLIILCGPCSISFVSDETGWLMLNLHQIYKPPSSWTILVLSGVFPSQFSCLKFFRILVVPGGDCRKGIFLQGKQLPTCLSVIGYSCLIIKG